MSKVVNFRCDEELFQTFKEITIAERRTLTESFERLVKEYVKIHSSNPQYSLDEFESDESERSPNFLDNGGKFEEFFKDKTVEEFQKYKTQLLLIEKKMLMIPI